MFINQFFLKIVLLPSSVYEKMGVNVRHLKAILTTKLMMDDRRPPSIQQKQQKKKDSKPIKWATLGTMLLSALLGILFIFSFFVSKDAITQFVIFFSFFIFLLASTLITDFTNVLIDIRDNAIILPKPINDKTFLLARLLHIVIHVSKLVLPMALPSLITVGIMYGSLGVLALLLLLPLITMFTIFLINALYILILKITTPEKFKSVISYFQIVFAIVVYGSYQIVPRLINMSALENYQFPRTPLALLAPPFWFAGSWEFLYHQTFSPIIITAFVFSLLMPALSIWLVVTYFAPSFNQKLAMISGSDAAPAQPAKNISSKTSKPFAEIAANLFTKKGAERMGFLHTWYITARSRDFKMRVYPAIGYLFVYMIVMILRSKKSMLEELQNQTTAGKFLFLGGIYFISFVIMQALSQIKYSDKYKASFLFYTTPITVPGHVISGAVKASIIKFYLPLAALISILGILFMGIDILPNLLLGMSNQLCICFLIAYVSFVEMPFSRTESITVKSGGFIRGLISMLIPFILATVHYLIYDFMVAVLILMVLSMIAVWLVAGSVYNKNWADLKVGYQD